MANRERGEISVKVGEKDYTLRPTFDAICEYEKLTGQTPEQFFDDFDRGRFAGIRASVWCVLQDEHSDEIKTLKDASRWIEDAGGLLVVVAHLKQLRDINATPVEEGKTNPPKARAGTGRRSSKARG